MEESRILTKVEVKERGRFVKRIVWQGRLRVFPGDEVKFLSDWTPYTVGVPGRSPVDVVRDI